MNRRLYFLFFLFLAFAFSGCRKSERDNNTSIVASEDHAMHERIINDVIAFVEESARTTQGIKVLHCAGITVDTVSNPKTITFNFDAFPNCTGTDGFQRKGTVVAAFTNKFSVVGSTVTISSSNYNIDDLKMSFQASMTYMGLDADNAPYFEVMVSSMKIEPITEDWTSSWTYNYTRTQTTGAATPSDITDDTYTLTGSGEGTNRKGNHYEAEITAVLTLLTTCDYPITGEVTVTPDNLPERILVYGNGCDNIATVHVVDTPYEIEIQ